MYGSPETTTGGRALKFYSTIRMDVRRVEQIKGPGSDFIGSKTKVKVVKNKVAPPFKEAEFDIMYGKGISKEGEILDLAVKLEIVQKSGAWFSYKGERLGQGRDNVKNYIGEHKELADDLEKQIRDNADKLFKMPKTPPKAPKGAKGGSSVPPAPASGASLDISVTDDE